MFFIEKEDKLLDNNFCDEFKNRIIRTFNSQKYKKIIDPQFLKYIASPGAIHLSKELYYSVEGDYNCDVTFEIKQEQSYVVSDGYEAKTTGTARTEYSTGNLKIDSKTTYTEKKHTETKTKYSQYVKTYKIHHSFERQKDVYRSSSSSEFGKIDPYYQREISEAIEDNERSYRSLERYSDDAKDVKKEYEDKVAGNVQITVKAKKVQITSPAISKVDVYGDYTYFATVFYKGETYTYSESDDFEENFPLNPDAEKKAGKSKKIYGFQRVLAWIMGIPTFIALGAILLVAIFVRFKGSYDFLTYITFPFTIIDIVVAILYVVLFFSFIHKLNEIISSKASKHMLHRKGNRNQTAVIEGLYYLVAIGSLVLAIFQLICVVNAFKVALTFA